MLQEVEIVSRQPSVEMTAAGGMETVAAAGMAAATILGTAVQPSRVVIPAAERRAGPAGRSDLCHADPAGLRGNSC